MFLEYYNPLCNYVFNMIRNEDDAEDIVQDAFLKLWDVNDQITLTETLKTYLFKSVKNKTLEFIRSRSSYNKMIEQNAFLSKEVNDADTSAELFLKMEKLNQSLRHLPPKCRHIFALHRFNGLSYAEIAESEKISVKTVENHMIKALRILRTHFKGKQ